MSQTLEVNIKTTNDVPAAMDKAKTATVSFAKQVEDVQKKFSTAFKDIFLGFVAPMVLLQNVISFVSNAIAQAKQDAKDGIDLMSRGESKFSNQDEAWTASFFKRRRELEEERRLIEAGRQKLTEQIITDKDLAKGLILPASVMQQLQSGVDIKQIAKDEGVQRIALDFLNKTEKGRQILAETNPATTAQPANNFKGPEGFGNVVGVGNNPVMEAQQAQLEELKLQTALLSQIANAGTGSVDFTKGTTPSRAALLMGK